MGRQPRRMQGRHAATGAALLLKLPNSSCSRCSGNRDQADHFLVNINSKSGRAAAGMPARSSRGRRNTPRRCTARQGLRSIVASTATPLRRGPHRGHRAKNQPRFVSNSHDEPLCVTLQLVRMSGRRAPFRRDLTADSGRRADPNSTQPLSAPRRRPLFAMAPATAPRRAARKAPRDCRPPEMSRLLDEKSVLHAAFSPGISPVRKIPGRFAVAKHSRRPATDFCVQMALLIQVAAAIAAQGSRRRFYPGFCFDHQRDCHANKNRPENSISGLLKVLGRGSRI